MSKEQLKAFLEKVKADTSLQEKLKAAASPEAAIEIAKEAGFAITAEDIQSTPIQSESATAELTDDELEAATGGGKLSGSWAGRCCSTRDSWCRETVDGHCQSRNTSRATGGC